MPAHLRKLPGKNLYRVKDAEGRIHSYGTTKKRAKAQVRLLNGVAHGMVAKPHKCTSKCRHKLDTHSLAGDKRVKEKDTVSP